MQLETFLFHRKPFPVKSARVTLRNMEAATRWCQGEIRTDDAGKKYIFLDIEKAANDRQKMAYVGDWVLYAGTGFKFYTHKAFLRAFDNSGQTEMVILPDDGVLFNAAAGDVIDTSAADAARARLSAAQPVVERTSPRPVPGPMVIDRGRPRPKPGKQVPVTVKQVVDPESLIQAPVPVLEPAPGEVVVTSADDAEAPNTFVDPQQGVEYHVVDPV